MEEQKGSRRSKNGPATKCAIAWAVAAILVLGLYGCTTFGTARAVPTRAPTPSPALFDPSLLRVGMSMDDVRRLEPPPEKTLAMTSQTMTVVEWVYHYDGSTAKVFFTNGLLESWTT